MESRGLGGGPCHHSDFKSFLSCVAEEAVAFLNNLQRTREVRSTAQ